MCEGLREDKGERREKGKETEERIVGPMCHVDTMSALNYQFNTV